MHPCFATFGGCLATFFRKLAEWIPKWSLRHVPLLSWIILLGGGYALRISPMRGLLDVSFSIDPAVSDPLAGWRHVVVLSAAAFLTSAACLVTFHLIGMAPTRFHLDAGPPHNGLAFVLAHIPPLVFITFVVAASGNGLSLYLAVICGWIVAFVVVLVSDCVKNLFTDDGNIGHPLSLIWPAAVLGNNPISRLLRRCRERDVPIPLLKQAFLRPGAWLRAKLESIVGPGYFGPDTAAAHIYASFIAVGTFVLYVFFANIQEYVLTSQPRGRAAGIYPVLRLIQSHVDGWINIEGLSALTWVLFFLALATWTLAAATFFLDHFRVPLFLGVLGLSLITWNVRSSDLFYRTEDPQARTGAKPADACVSDPVADWRCTPAQIAAKHPGPLVVVSAPGGGIQSAVWTTYVLSQLDKVTDFSKRIAAISSVSGGSVGVFHLVAAKFDTDAAYKKSIFSSIDDVAWGLFVPDLAHIFEPWRPAGYLDRGWALEQSLEKNAGVLAEEPYLRSLARTSLPALILNSTILEIGHPIVFSTSRFTDPVTRDAHACGASIQSAENSDGQTGSTDPYDFWDVYHRDVRVVPAARMSASFPYVSPSARPFAENATCADYHLLDGGYYDNYGIVSLIKWVQKAVAGDKDRKIILVRLYGFPESQPKPSAHGWGLQTHAPVEGVLNARDDSQLAIGTYIASLLDSLGVHRVEVIPFQYQGTAGACSDPPLNWVVTQEDLQCIAANKIDKDNEGVIRLLAALLP